MAACGGGTDEGVSRPSDAPASDGRELFAQRCAACHSLADAKATGTVGPNLDEVRPSAQRVESKVRNGGGGMPAFEGQLSDSQIQAVAAYVAQVAGG